MTLLKGSHALTLLSLGGNLLVYLPKYLFLNLLPPPALLHLLSRCAIRDVLINSLLIDRRSHTPLLEVIAPHFPLLLLQLALLELLLLLLGALVVFHFLELGVHKLLN